MPQITVTVDDDVYWDLMNLPKGLKSKFVSRSVAYVIDWKYEGCARNMYAWAKGRPLNVPDLASHPNQSKLGVEEE